MMKVRPFGGFWYCFKDYVPREFVEGLYRKYGSSMEEIPHGPSTICVRITPRDEASAQALRKAQSILYNGHMIKVELEGAIKEYIVASAAESVGVPYRDKQQIMAEIQRLLGRLSQLVR